MPFPLAHPAAVIPLKSKWPRQLNLAALVIGSICPDVGYFWSRQGMDVLSHSLKGAWLFCLPVGIVMLAGFYLTRRLMVRLLPSRLRQPFTVLCEQPVGSIWTMLLSLLLGIATHLIWDSFTHRNGWLHDAVVLHRPLYRVGYHVLTICQIFRYLSSFAGAACLCYYFEYWWHTAHSEAIEWNRNSALIDATIAGLLVIPMQILNDLMGTMLGHALVITAIFLFFVLVMLRLGSKLRDPRAQASGRIPKNSAMVG